MKALGPIPPGFDANATGSLLIGGRDAGTLVGEAGGTPLFVYDSRRIADQVARFRGAFPSEVSLHYAVKANPYAPLLDSMASLVDGFDVASADELETLDIIGPPSSTMPCLDSGKPSANRIERCGYGNPDQIDDEEAEAPPGWEKNRNRHE